MMYRRLTLAFIFMLLMISTAAAKAEETKDSDQQINDFSLSGFGEKGKKSWDISGKSADIFDNNVKLNDVTGNLYQEKDQVKLTADKGDFDKVEGSVHLEDNVVITTSTGAKLTTDSLDWDRKKQIVTTEAAVNIEKETMVTTAVGAVAEPNLNKVTLQKDVKVDLNPPAKTKTTITCDGPMTVDYDKNIATFNNNVKVDRGDDQIYSDTMDVYFSRGDETADSDMMGGKIEKIIARGNVKIARGENVSYSEVAVYSSLDKKITLLGKPQLVIYSTEDMDASAGD